MQTVSVRAAGFGLLCLVLATSRATAAADWLGEKGLNAAAVHALGEQGSGVHVGLMTADNARVTHEAFRGQDGKARASDYDYTGENEYKPSDHDTWVAGVVCSAGGAGHEADIGVAPEATIYSVKLTRGIAGPTDANRTTAFAYLAAALDSLVNTHGCRIIVTGMAFPDSPGKHPDGQSDWSLLYDYYASAHNVIFVNPSGKQFKAPTVFGDMYNGLTAGGLVLAPNGTYGLVGASSNSGPTIDGRRKPDVVAPAANMVLPSGASDTSWFTWPLNDGPTSFAAPGVGGVAALLLGLADKTAEPNDDTNAVIKAVIINSVDTDILDKAGKPTDPNGGVTVWNRDRGFGRVNAMRAYETLKAGRIGKGIPFSPGKGWAYGVLPPEAEQKYSIRWSGKGRLRCTLVWNRQVKWRDDRGRDFIDPGELTGRLPDLRLEVTGPSGKPIGRQNDSRSRKDNVVVVDLSDVEAGQITIRVWNNDTYGTSVPYGCAIEARD
jgi:hypothetical protein